MEGMQSGEAGAMACEADLSTKLWSSENCEVRTCVASLDELNDDEDEGACSASSILDVTYAGGIHIQTKEHGCEVLPSDADAVFEESVQAAVPVTEANYHTCDSVRQVSADSIRLPCISDVTSTCVPFALAACTGVALADIPVAGVACTDSTPTTATVTGVLETGVASPGVRVGNLNTCLLCSSDVCSPKRLFPGDSDTSNRCVHSRCRQHEGVCDVDSVPGELVPPGGDSDFMAGSSANCRSDDGLSLPLFRKVTAILETLNSVDEDDCCVVPEESWSVPTVRRPEFSAWRPPGHIGDVVGVPSGREHFVPSQHFDMSGGCCAAVAKASANRPVPMTKADTWQKSNSPALLLQEPSAPDCFSTVSLKCSVSPDDNRPHVVTHSVQDFVDSSMPSSPSYPAIGEVICPTPASACSDSTRNVWCSSSSEAAVIPSVSHHTALLHGPQPSYFTTDIGVSDGACFSDRMSAEVLSVRSLKQDTDVTMENTNHISTLTEVSTRKTTSLPFIPPIIRPCVASSTLFMSTPTSSLSASAVTLVKYMSNTSMSLGAVSGIRMPWRCLPTPETGPSKSGSSWTGVDVSPAVCLSASNQLGCDVLPVVSSVPQAPSSSLFNQSCASNQPRTKETECFTVPRPSLGHCPTSVVLSLRSYSTFAPSPSAGMAEDQLKLSIYRSRLMFDEDNAQDDDNPLPVFPHWERLSVIPGSLRTPTPITTGPSCVISAAECAAACSVSTHSPILFSTHGSSFVSLSPPLAFSGSCRYIGGVSVRSAPVSSLPVQCVSVHSLPDPHLSVHGLPVPYVPVSGLSDPHLSAVLAFSAPVMSFSHGDMARNAGHIFPSSSTSMEGISNHFLPPNLFPPSPLISEHFVRSYFDIMDQKPWFSILPRTPCIDLSSSIASCTASHLLSTLKNPFMSTFTLPSINSARQTVGLSSIDYLTSTSTSLVSWSPVQDRGSSTPCDASFNGEYQTALRDKSLLDFISKFQSKFLHSSDAACSSSVARSGAPGVALCEESFKVPAPPPVWENVPAEFTSDFDPTAELTKMQGERRPIPIGEHFD